MSILPLTKFQEGLGTDPDNTSKRIPVVLCLDTSGSMSGNIGDLNQAIQQFYDESKNDENAKNSVEVAAIQFGNGRNNGVDIVSDFMEVEHASIPTLRSGGVTPMGSGVQQSLALLDARKEWYRQEGVDYYQPILVLMTDGEATDAMESAANDVKVLTDSGKLTVIPLAFGDDANLSKLTSIAGGKQPIYIDKGFRFLEFFKWLSMSFSSISQNVTEEEFDNILAEFTLDDQ